MRRAGLLAGWLLLTWTGCAVAPGSNGAALVAQDRMESVVKQTWTTRDFRLESGEVLPELTLAYESYGRLALFPPSIAPAVMDKLAKAGVQASYFEIDTELGHTASGPEWAKWGPTLQKFVEGLDR
jgi:homoserine acetyltransferase